MFVFICGLFIVFLLFFVYCACNLASKTDIELEEYGLEEDNYE